MTNLAILHPEKPAGAAGCDYLGPARVVGTHALHVEVELPTGRVVRATRALAFPYDACVDDSVLVIGNGGGHYLIGVLMGSGRTVLEMHGDVDLRAVGGKLRLSSDREVAIDAPEVALSASRLHVLADAVAHTFTTLRQRVRELWSVQAGATHTVVEGTAFSQSKSATMLTEEKMTLNGKAIHLG